MGKETCKPVTSSYVGSVSNVPCIMLQSLRHLLCRDALTVDYKHGSDASFIQSAIQVQRHLGGGFLFKVGTFQQAEAFMVEILVPGGKPCLQNCISHKRLVTVVVLSIFLKLFSFEVVSSEACPKMLVSSQCFIFSVFGFYAGIIRDYCA